MLFIEGSYRRAGLWNIQLRSQSFAAPSNLDDIGQWIPGFAQHPCRIWIEPPESASPSGRLLFERLSGHRILMRLPYRPAPGFPWWAHPPRARSFPWIRNTACSSRGSTRSALGCVDVPWPLRTRQRLQRLCSSVPCYTTISCCSSPQRKAGCGGVWVSSKNAQPTLHVFRGHRHHPEKTFAYNIKHFLFISRFRFKLNIFLSEFFQPFHMQFRFEFSICSLDELECSSFQKGVVKFLNWIIFNLLTFSSKNKVVLNVFISISDLERPHWRRWAWRPSLGTLATVNASERVVIIECDMDDEAQNPTAGKVDNGWFPQ